MEHWSDSGCFDDRIKRSASRLNMEGKKGSKDDNKALSLNNWKDRAAIYSDVKMSMDLLKCFKIR